MRREKRYRTQKGNSRSTQKAKERRFIKKKTRQEKRGQQDQKGRAKPAESAGGKKGGRARMGREKKRDNS